MMSDLKKGDQVIIISPRVSRRGPWPVQQIDEDGKIWLKEVTKGGNRRVEIYPRGALIKIDLNINRTEAVRQALIAHVPANLRCQICNLRPGSESHFITVPIPKAFTRLCVEDRTDITQEIRKRVSAVVSEIFAEAKAGQLKKLLKEEIPYP